LLRKGTAAAAFREFGRSYEVQQLVNPAFFSPKNAGLIREFKALSTHGVLRLGGNTSEFEWWKPTITRRSRITRGREMRRASPRRSTTL
jgi:hypothetical protein